MPNGRNRGDFKAWLDISNSYMQVAEAKPVKKSTRSYSRLPSLSKSSFPRTASSKPMFILISEKELNLKGN